MMGLVYDMLMTVLYAFNESGHGHVRQCGHQKVVRCSGPAPIYCELFDWMSKRVCAWNGLM